MHDMSLESKGTGMRALRARPCGTPGGLAAAVLMMALIVPAARAGGEGDSVPSETDSTDIAASVLVPPPGQHEILPAPERPIRVGESLRFSVQWKFAHAGTAWLEVPEMIDHERPAGVPPGGARGVEWLREPDLQGAQSHRVHLGP